MLKGLAIGIEHFPDYQPYECAGCEIGGMPFARGINVLIGSDLEQGMEDCDFEQYSRAFAVIVPKGASNSVPFEELVFG